MVRTTGTVKWFNDEKGWGFLQSPDGHDVFVHHKNIVGLGRRALVPGETVDFDLDDGPKGRFALNVARRGGAASGGTHAEGHSAAHASRAAPVREHREVG